jgi:hypothetical protein
MPLCPSRALTKSSIWFFHSRFGSTVSLMLGRSNPSTTASTLLSNNCSAMSARVPSSAVAVSAAIGTLGNTASSRDSA